MIRLRVLFLMVLFSLCPQLVAAQTIRRTAAPAHYSPALLVAAASKAAAADSPLAPRTPSDAGNTDSEASLGSVALSVCNAGKVDIEVFVSQSGKVSRSHIVAAACAFVAKSVGSMAPAYVGLAFVDAGGQWGVARRQDLLPDFGDGVLNRANQSVPVQHGNTTVSLPMQLLFQPRVPQCTTYRSATERLGFGATRAERDHAAMLDANSRRLGLDKPSCETLAYALNVVAYPDSREITFNKFCDPCEKKAQAHVTPEERAAHQQRAEAVNQVIENLKDTGGPLGALIMGNVVNQGKQQAQEEERERGQERSKQRPESYQRMNWNDMNLALANVRGSGGRPPEVPQYLIVRGTVSRVDLSPPAASEHWVNVYFRESPEQASTMYETVYGAFNVCASDAGIFEDMFGPDFRSRMIGQVLEVRGEYQRNYCKGWKGSIRVTLARQLHSAGSKSGKDQSTDSGIGYGDFLKAVAKAQEEEPKRPPVVSMQTQMAAHDERENRERWAASHQSPASYEPQWMGQNMVVMGTVSRVEVTPGRPPWVTIYFKESPDSTFVVCSPYPDMFQERVGSNLSVLVGKALQAAGQVESPYCGHKVPKGSIRVVESKQWQVQ